MHVVDQGRISAFTPVLILLVLALYVAFPTGTALSASAVDVDREQIEIELFDFVSDGELTYPANEDGPFPTVILIHGSGIADMDHTVTSPYEFGPTGPRVLSQNFREIAERLSGQGFAVLRYNKRYVTGVGQADYARFYQLSLQDMLMDAEAVLEAAKAHPKVDAENIIVYGWSEGSTIAAALAAERSDVAGLVLQTPVVYPWKETFMYQLFEVGFPYVLEFVEDGHFTISSIGRGMQGEGGLVAKSTLSYLVDPAYVSTGELSVNGILDTDGDGKLKFGTELTLSRLAGLIEQNFAPGGYFAMYGPQVALPTVGDRIGSLELPVLILQGGADANVPPQGADLLARGLSQVGADVTFYFYPELGHALGEATTRRTDNFQPIAETPLNDLAEWLKLRFSGR